MDEPIQRFVREVVRKEPDTALTWAEAIVDEERKQRVVTEVKRVAERAAEREQQQRAPLRGLERLAEQQQREERGREDFELLTDPSHCPATLASPHHS